MVSYVINEEKKNMSKKDINFRKLEIIRRVATLCTDDQISKIDDFIFDLWNKEEEQEKKDRKEFEEWKQKKLDEEMPF
tara:strand:- start:106 stop:339 length:234 start_codon:yes stop_codon:yes gene_type:complete